MFVKYLNNTHVLFIMLVYFCLPKRYRKSCIYVFFILFIIFVIFIVSLIYVSNNLNIEIIDEVLYITNPTSIPIRVYSINRKFYNQRIVNNESFEYKLKKNDIEEGLELVLKYCILKFPTKLNIE